jgi:hypothetical protein
MQIRESVEKALYENAIDLITPELQSGVGHTFGFDALDLFAGVPILEELKPVIERLAKELQPKWHFAFTVQGLMINFSSTISQGRLAILEPDTQDAIQEMADIVITVAMGFYDQMLTRFLLNLVQTDASHV